MSKLSQLQGKPKTYKLGEVDLEIKPLKLDDMNLFTMDQNATSKEQTENSLKLIHKVLTESVPDSTEEERKNVGIAYMEDLMNAIMDVNGLTEQRSKIDAIKARQTQTANIGK